MQTDAAGNASDPSEAVRVTVDVNPSAPVVTGPPNGTVVNNGALNPPITGEHGVPGDTITIYDRGIAICTTIVDPAGQWSCTPAEPLSVGTHRLSIVETDPNGVDSAAAYLILTVRPADDLAVTVSVTHDTVTVGGATTVVVTVVNKGPNADPAVHVSRLRDRLLNYRSSHVTAGAFASASGVWTVGALAVGQRRSLSMTFTGAAVGTATLSPTVSGTVTDTVTRNNTASVGITVDAAVAPAGGTSNPPLASTGTDSRAGLLDGLLLLLAGFTLTVAARSRRRIRH